jgi:hypothetical protein
VPGDETSRELLRQADAELRTIEFGDAPRAANFEKWQKDWPARRQQLRSAEPNSLFSEAVLRRFLSR